MTEDDSSDRQGWSLINGLYFDLHGDVDHVLVGPDGVFVLESKWTSTPCHLEGSMVSGIAGREPVAQALAGARKIELLLRYGPTRMNVAVRPVVILWGPGAPTLADGFAEVAGVLVFEGRKSRKWLPSLGTSNLAPGVADRAKDVLRDQLHRQVERLASQSA